MPTSPPPAVTERNLSEDGGAFARCGGNSEIAADHLQSFAHAEQAQAFTFFSAQDAVFLKAFAVVCNFHANGAVKFLNIDFGVTGPRVAGDIGEGFLRHTIEGGPFVAVDVLHRSEGRQADADASFLAKVFHKGMK